MTAENRQAEPMQGWRLGPSGQDVVALVGFTVTIFAAALALFNSPKGRLLSTVIAIVSLLLIFGLFPPTKPRG
jgi:predicted RND superfamily exporter protein